MELNKNHREKVKGLNRLQCFVQNNNVDLSVVRSLDRVIMNGICWKYKEQYLVGQHHTLTEIFMWTREIYDHSTDREYMIYIRRKCWCLGCKISFIISSKKTWWSTGAVHQLEREVNVNWRYSSFVDDSKVAKGLEIDFSYPQCSLSTDLPRRPYNPLHKQTCCSMMSIIDIILIQSHLEI